MHGKQFRDAALIVASPPCQNYSYMAMPWTKAKALATWYRDPAYPERLHALNELFDAPFRIQREAIAAAGGRFIPLVLENVRGAIPWVGRSRWNFGSYHLWGDVPALMPIARKPVRTTERSDGCKTVGMNWSNHELRGQDFTGIAGRQVSAAWRAKHYDATAKASHHADGVKQGGDWFNATALWQETSGRRSNSKPKARKAASARIAMIPLALARHIARAYYPVD